MGYTYNDFLSAAKTAGVMDRFTQSDLAVAQKNPEFGISLTGLLKDIGSATTAEQQLLATEAANQLRKNYGVYSTGNDTASTYASSYGSNIDELLGKINDYGSFSYENQDAYQALLDSIVNQGAFRYDAATDPTFSAYKKMYMREGDRASANAMARASAASGGRPSSYALTAAQQAGNYYAGQLSDALPALEQQAYSKYLNDFSSRLNSLNALQSDRAFDMEAWMNEYNMMQNGLGNYQTQAAADYQRYLDAMNQQTQADQMAFENALALYQTLGYATPGVAKVLGLNAGSSGGGYGYTGSSGGSGGFGGGGGSGYDNGSLTNAQIRELQNALGVAADGLYGRNSRNAAGGLSAEEAYAKYVTGVGGDLYGDMIGAIESESENGGTPDYSVTNKNGSGWIMVGSSRMTWTELEKRVNRGEIIEVVDKKNGTVTYKYASTGSGSKNTGTGSGTGSGSGSGGSGGSGSGGTGSGNRKNMLNTRD